MHIDIGTTRFISITILLTFDIPFIFYDDMEIDNVIEVTNSDVDVTLIRRSNRRYVTSTNVSLSFDRSCGFNKKLEQDKISIKLTQISLNVVTDLNG
jgi:hypothetical protein